MSQKPKRKKPEENSGCLSGLMMAFILVFFVPIMWLAKKMDTGAPNAGLGSGMLAIMLIMLGTGITITALVIGAGVVAYKAL